MRETLEPTGYGSIEERKSTGAHYTPRILAGFVAKELVGARPEIAEGKRLYLLDPACGDGELLISALDELSKQGISGVHVCGFDTDENAARRATARIKAAFPETTLSIGFDSFLEYVLEQADDNLFRSRDSVKFDMVIANPPYVRTQVLGAERARMLAKQFGLSGRTDLYHAFILGISRVLRPGGVAGIIVSNRFMTTKAGERVRSGILDAFEVLHVWDLGDTRLFEAAVLPAVLLLRRRNGEASAKPRFTSIYSIRDESPAQPMPNAIEALSASGVVELEDGERFFVQHGKLHHGDKLTGVWRITHEELNSWMASVEANTYCRFADLGRIHVGVKTNADRVFIRSDWDSLPDGEQPELLRPLITHHIARRYKSQPVMPVKQILYPHEVVQGKRRAVDLNEYPGSERYLSRHRAVLQKREYLIGSGRKWYEIWVPQDPDAWALPKIVFRDISKTPTFWMDLTGSVVNGDCYWLACEDPARLDLLWLALAVGNSSFIEVFYDRRFHNKLYAGRRRFMTQYVEEFPLPDPRTDVSMKIIRIAQDIYEVLPEKPTDKLEREIGNLVWQAFGLPVEEVAR